MRTDRELLQLVRNEWIKTLRDDSEYREWGYMSLCKLVSLMHVVSRDKKISFDEEVRLLDIIEKRVKEENIHKPNQYLFSRPEDGVEQAYKERLDFLNRMIKDLWDEER